MEENNISDVINKFSDILKEKDIDINNLGNLKGTENTEESKGTYDSGFNFDINTILKLKKITEKLNNSNNNRSSLLQALRPFLSTNKQSKLDEYIKIVNILNVLEALNGEI